MKELIGSYITSFELSAVLASWSLESYVAICWVVYVVVILGIILHQSYCFNLREYNSKLIFTTRKSAVQSTKQRTLQEIKVLVEQLNKRIDYYEAIEQQSKIDH